MNSIPPANPKNRDLDPPGPGTGLSSVSSIFGVVFFVLLSALIVFFTDRDIDTHESTQRTILDASIEKAGYTVEIFIDTRRRHIEAFSKDNADLIRGYVDSPEDQEARATIDTRLRLWFPEYFTFTVADTAGNDLIDDLEGFVGRICQASIQSFAEARSGQEDTGHMDEVVIHPMANNYHFDIMAPWRPSRELAGVFFVSFFPGSIAEILRSFESPGHRLVLVNRDRPGLIEVTAKGARDVISTTREINLSAEETEAILHRKPINGSRWELVGYPAAGLFAAYAADAWRDATILIAALFLATALAIIAMQRLERRRMQAQRALEQKTDELSNTVDALSSSKAALEAQAQRLRELADQQKTLRETAEAAEKAKSEFLASMSHEIRTPMTGVVGFADLLLHQNLEPESRRMVHKIKGSAWSLMRIINDILDMSKLEAGKMELEYLDFHLPALVREVAGMFEEQPGGRSGKPVDLRVDLSDGFPIGINSDPTRLRQILVNLVGNAKKLTEAGSITVHGQMIDEGAPKPMIRFAVEDTGIGIGPDVRDDLFTEFKQADASISRRFAGTGLGLSICKKLVELLGGEIGVESEYGKGSTFWFTLPFTPATSHVDSLEAISQTVSHFVAERPLSILVVDDNELNRQIVGSILTGMGHGFKIAENGQQAVEMHENGGFDLILMDVRMPVMSGPDATRLIRRAAGAKATIPIIALTADAMEEHKAAYFEAGMDGVVTKPIDRIDLALVINDVMGEEINLPKAHQPSAATDVPAEEPIDDGQLAAVDDFLKQIDASID